MFVPVVGPVAWLGISGGSTSKTYLLGMDSIGQAAGVVLFALGVRGRVGWERKPGFLLVPMANAEGGGLSASGVF